MSSKPFPSLSLFPDAQGRTDYPRRGVVLSRHGMIATIDPLASSAGLAVLRSGGNAIDATIAAAAVLCVTNPWSGQIGGDAFMQIYHAATGQVYAINASGPAPRRATRERYLKQGGIPEAGLLAATVPGIVGGWDLAIKRFGRQSLREVLQPAIEYAQQGFVAHQRFVRNILRDRDKYAQFAETARLFLPQHGQAPAVGSIFRQPELGETLGFIAEGGADAFYRGPLAKRMIQFSERNGGVFDSEDFASYSAEILPPLTLSYRGFTISEQPPVSQGIVLLLMLGILEGFDMGQLGFGAPAALHLMIEAKKIAFGERQRILGDPRYIKIPVAELLSETYLRELRGRINRYQALPEPAMKDKKLYGGDTTYLCCVDEEGHAVSYIHSLYTGCGVVMGDTGVLMNSRMLGFSLHEDHPNVLEPGKRPVHTLNTFLILEDGRPCLVGGTPGADMQVQTNLQVITNLLDFGMDVGEAVDAPRWGSFDGFQVVLEDRFPSEVATQLSRRGHMVEIKPAWSSSGSVQLIGLSAEPRVFVGSTEPRHDGGYIVAY